MRIRSSLSVRTLTLLSLLAAIPACSKDKKTTTPEEGAAVVQASSSAKVDTARSGGLVQVANADLSKGRYNAAAKRAREALDANPESAEAWNVLGAASWRAGDLKASIEAYEKSVSLDPKSFGAVVGYAQVLQASGRHDRAISILDALIAAETENFKPGPCNDDNTCDGGGVCENGTCNAPMQVAPRFVKLGSQYLLLDVDGGLKTADDIFVGVGARSYETDFARAYASFLRPLAGKGPLVTIEGEQGKAPLGIDYQLGVRFSEFGVAGQSKMVVLNDVVNETQIDAGFASELGLKPVGQVTPYGSETPVDLVLVPEVKVGDLLLKNVPALVQNLEIYGQALGQVPGLVLGQQTLVKLGAVRYDLPKNELTVFKTMPAEPEGATEVPMLVLNMLAARLSAVQMSLDGSGKSFWGLFGGTYQSGVAVSKKEYLRAGHRPEDLENPEVVEQGLKVVLVDKVKLGELTEQGVGGLVFLNTPPDANLNGVVVTTGFNLDGYVNSALFARWAVTVNYKNSKLYIESPALVAAGQGEEKKPS